MVGRVTEVYGNDDDDSDNGDDCNENNQGLSVVYPVVFPFHTHAPFHSEGCCMNPLL